MKNEWSCDIVVVEGSVDKTVIRQVRIVVEGVVYIE